MSDLVNTLEKADSFNRTDHSTGLLDEQQREKFLSIVWSKRDLLNKVRKVLMPAEEYSTMGIYPTGSGLSAVDSDSEDISLNEIADEFYKIKLKAHEYAMTRSIDLNFLQDNIEGKGFGKKVAEILAEKASENILDAGINGQVVSTTPTAGTSSGATAIDADELVLTADPVTLNFPEESLSGYLAYDTGSGIIYMTYTGIDSASTKFTGLSKGVSAYNLTDSLVDASIPDASTISWVDHKLRKKQAGWLDILENGSSLNTNLNGAQILDGSLTNSGSLTLEHLRLSIASLDSAFLNTNYVWVMSRSQHYKLETNIMNASSSNLKDKMFEGGQFKPLGYNVITLEDKFMPTNRLLFLDPKNLLIGYYKNVTIKSTEEGKTAINNNKRYYSLRTRFAYGVEAPEAAVVVNGLV